MRWPVQPPAVDFVTALPLEDCLHQIQRGVRRAGDHRLSVRVQGVRVVVEAGAGASRGGQPAPLWLFRFVGDLTAVSAGTRVSGAIVRNRALDGVLVLPGVFSGFSVVLSLVMAVPSGSALGLVLLALFGACYALYDRLTRQQAHDLAQQVYEWLTVPQGRASWPV